MGGPAWSEVAQLVSGTARALSLQGVEAHVFTGRGPGQTSEAVVGGVEYHRCAHDEDPDPRVEAANFSRALLSGLHRVEKAGSFTVVHGFEWPAAGVLGKLRCEDNRTTVWSFFHPHEDWQPPFWLVEEEHHTSQWSYHPDDFAGRVIAPSSEARQSFIERWGMSPERVDIVHPGIDPCWAGDAVDPAQVKASYGFAVFDPMILFIGDLSPEARPGMLLDAIPSVLERHPHAKVVFAGDGELSNSLADRARVLGIEAAIRLSGELPAADVARLCRSCDVVCLPQRSRSLLSPVLQAWSAAKPVVITPAHSSAIFVWPEVTGYICEESASGLTEGLLWMFQDFERCRWIGENGRRAVDDAFGWSAVAGRLLECYRRAAEERHIRVAHV